MKPIIGVSPLWDDDRSSIWMLPGYLNAIRESGGIPITFPLQIDREDLKQLFRMCDGFLLTGGDDVNPALYGEPKGAACGMPNDLRDSLEREIFRYAVEHDVPTFGICRGIQFINALCGGTLYQDLPSEYRGCESVDHIDQVNHVNHQMTPPYDKPCHRVHIVDDTPLAELVPYELLDVNSYHHQAIKSLAPTLRAMAISEDGLVEAVYMPQKRFVQAVQWHPEFNYHCDEVSRKIVDSFIAHCRR